MVKQANAKPLLAALRWTDQEVAIAFGDGLLVGKGVFAIVVVNALADNGAVAQVWFRSFYRALAEARRFGVVSAGAADQFSDVLRRTGVDLHGDSG